MRSTRIWIGVALMVLACQPLAAGVRFRMETREAGAEDAKPVRTELLAGTERLRVDSSAGPGEGLEAMMIYRGDKAEMVVLNHADRTYMVLDRETMEKLGSTLSTLEQQIQEALKGVPDAQREMMEKMMRERMGDAMGGGAAVAPELEVRETGRQDTLHGYPCRLYELYRGEEKVQELWITPWSRVEGAEDVAELLQEMGELLQGFVEAFESGSGFNVPLAAGDLGRLWDLEGFPVVSRSFRGGELQDETIFKGAQSEEFAASDFTPPEGYQRQEMPDMPSLGGQG